MIIERCLLRAPGARGYSIRLETCQVDNHFRMDRAFLDSSETCLYLSSRPITNRPLLTP